ncbi:MFS transporter [Shimia sp.]|uniref:MFS transporter n=1 Tax=Shimia sp. TaxID=1954381 RepID=UPI003297C063
MTTRLPTNLILLFVMELFSGISRGSFLVCVGWTTLIVTNDVSRVGQVFIIAMLTLIVTGPFIGTIVDRHTRKWLVILAHLAIAVLLCLLGTIWISAPSPSLPFLFAAIAAASALRLLHNTAHDGLIQSIVPANRIMRTVARFRGVHLSATALGTVLAGFVIEQMSPAAGFLFSAAASVLLIVPMLFVTDTAPTSNGSTKPAFLGDLRGGLEIFRQSRPLRLLALLAAVSLPIGQLSNAILSSFIRDDLGKGSSAFGIVDAAWPVGGMLAAGLLSLGIRKVSAHNMEYVFAVLVGCATFGLSLCTSLPMLALLHCAMGMTVWLCRIVIDGRVLERSTTDTIGRTKVGIDMAFSLAALIMCFSPTLVRLPSTAPYFMVWGALIVVVAGLVWFLDARRPHGSD